MQKYKTPTAWIIRLDKGEEIITTLKEFCTQNSITLGNFQGIGATNKVTLGLFETTTKTYHSKVLHEDLEIAPVIGNITTKDGEVYLHAHITVSGKDFHAYAGHLQEAWISATCEVILTPHEGTVERLHNQDVGLNLMDFSQKGTHEHPRA